MKSILTVVTLASAAASQGPIAFDTTITLKAMVRDSFYIPAAGQYLYFNSVTTASCPAYTIADFVERGMAGKNTNVEKVPADAAPLIHTVTHCAGSESTGIPAEKVFTFADRHYTIGKSGYDLYFRVTGITEDDRAHLEFSASPFATGIAPRQEARKPARKELSLPGPAGKTYLANGRKIRGRGD